MSESSSTEKKPATAVAPVVRQGRPGSAELGLWPRIQPQAEALALALQFQFRESERWPPARLLANQHLQVQHLIRHAVATVPFYAERLAPVAELPPGRMTIDAFREVPLLTRREIQDAGNALVTSKLPAGHGRMYPVKTSGSTGEPVEVKATGLTSIFTNAFTMRGHLWHRRNLSQKNVDIRTWYESGKAPKQSRWAATVRTGPSVRLDLSRPIAELLDDFLEEDPAYLQTRPYTLLGLVERSLEVGKKPQRLREVRTFGEVLRPHIREVVKEHWNVPVVDNYSAMKIATIAHQCPESTNLHVMAEGVLLEVIDGDGRPCEAGDVGTTIGPYTATHGTLEWGTTIGTAPGAVLVLFATPND